ncbi:recombination protein RecR [candidate division WOR-3 bacterium]|nr:recombination protein RecR [candidate division WOR-3 bacterium]
MRRSLEQLVSVLAKLPGIGPKTAQRIAFFLLKQPDASRRLAEAMVEAGSRLRPCPVCFSLTEDEPCEVCADAARDHSLVCVVEEPSDVLTIEQSGQHRGTYHVLGGVLSPMDNVGPEDLRVRELLARAVGGVREIIIATNPTTEGEATAIYLARQLETLPVRVTRIARGLPVGSDLDLADAETILRALEGRREL